MKLIDPNELEKVLRPILTDESCPLHIAAEIDMNIDLMPKVDAVPVVHGFWINIMEENTLRRKCSVCGEVFIANSDKHDFCGCCGADMRKDGHDGRS